MGRNREPDPDDYGLPPIDVAVPDDARELENDVLAYHRELRQERLRRRWRRLTGPLTRYGVAAPFIAAALLVSLVSATLMTVLASRPPRTAQGPADTGTSPARIPGGAPPGAAGTPLPDRTIALSSRGDTGLRGGGDRRRLRDLRPAIIALITTGCRCAGALEELAERGLRHRIPVYLITSGPPGHHARTLADPTGTVRTGQDTKGALFTTYRPRRLTVVLVRVNGTVAEVHRDVRPGAVPEHRLAELRGPS